MAILECKDLTKYYDRTLGLDHLSLQLEPGRIVGLLGPNGSGKTTLLKIANGLLTPSSGQLLIDGKAPGPDTRRLVSYLPERTYLSDWMTVVQLLDFFCDFYPDFDREAAEHMLTVYALLLASAGCCSLFYKLAADHPYRTGAASVLMGLLMMAFWIFVVATGAITALLMTYRFYKNYMTDEGYLMFTLPVNRHQLIWAKLLSALLYTAASAVAVTLSILLVLLPIADWSGFWGDLGELLSSITESLHFGVPGPLLLLWIAVLAILTVFSGFLMVYAAIALGHSFSNHKILLSVVFFIAFSLAMQAAGLSSFAFQLTVGEQIIETSGSAASLLDGTRFLVIDSIETLVACGVFYTLTWYSLQKRLNLQ